MRLDVFREKKAIQVEVTVGLRNIDQVSRLDEPAPVPEAASGLGMTVETLTSERAKQLGYGPETKGVVVTKVTPEGLAARVGIQPQDVIDAIDGKSVANSEAFRKAVGKSSQQQGVRMRIKRDGNQRFVFLKQS